MKEQNRVKICMLKKWHGQDRTPAGTAMEARDYEKDECVVVGEDLAKTFYAIKAAEVFDPKKHGKANKDMSAVETKDDKKPGKPGRK